MRPHISKLRLMAHLRSVPIPDSSLQPASKPGYHPLLNPRRWGPRHDCREEGLMGMTDRKTIEWRGAIAGAVGALAAVGILGAAAGGQAGHIVRAERFEVTDKA